MNDSGVVFVATMAKEWHLFRSFRHTTLKESIRDYALQVRKQVTTAPIFFLAHLCVTYQVEALSNFIFAVEQGFPTCVGKYELVESLTHSIESETIQLEDSYRNITERFNIYIFQFQSANRMHCVGCALLWRMVDYYLRKL